MIKLNGELRQKKTFISGKLVPMWALSYISIDLVIEDIKRFIALHEGLAATPFRGSNMTGKASRERTIPIKVTFSPEEWKEMIADTDAHFGTYEDDKPTKGKKKPRLDRDKLHEILKTSARIENKNHIGTQSEITRILSMTPMPTKIHYTTDPLPKHGGKNAIEALQAAFKGKGTPLKNLGPGLGVIENELVIFPDIDNKCVYIIFCMPPGEIGETTGREVFSKKIPDNVYTVNGEFGIKIPATIAIDADVFISVISECVQLSRGANHLIVPNFISPIKLGIFLTDDIFAKIQPGGEIYQALLKLGIVLHYKRAPGPRGTSGVRLSRISWTITDDTEHIPVATPLGTQLDEFESSDFETPDYESLDLDCSTKYEIFHDDVPMIISVFAEECDYEECDLDECDANAWGWILVSDH